MNRDAGIWAMGLVGSLAAHGVLLAVLASALRPDLVTEQPMPPSELDVQAYRLDRETARAARPAAEAARAGDATGAAVASGAISQARARPLPAPAGAALAAAEAPADRLSPDTTRAAPLPHAVPSEAPRLAPAARPAPVLTPAVPAPAAAVAQKPPAPAAVSLQAPQAQVARASPPLPQAIAAAAPPAPRPASVAPVEGLRLAVLGWVGEALVAAEPAIPAAAPRPPEGDALGPSAPAVAAAGATALPTDPLPAAAPQRAAAPAAPAETQKVKATLAFTGGDGEIDPVSLAAFQSFMRPGDIRREGDTLRDGVSALLAQVPCARLQVGFDPDSATLQVKGHVPEDDLRAPVLAALQAQMGADIAVSDNILILPRPQCGALSGISTVGLPQSTDQITNPLLIGEDTHARVLDFVKGDRLWFEITAPEYPAYIYVDYFDAGGNVLHLSPNDQVSLQRVNANSALRVGSRQAGDAGLQIFIGPPYGQEIAVAFAASEPLYDGLRPLVEPAAPYLEWLRTRIDAARDKNADFKGEWVYFFVTTAEG